jgi:PAS domain S-box-containing protein
MPIPTNMLLGPVEPQHFGEAELNLEERFVSMDAAYREMLGPQERELIGQHWRTTVYGDDLARVAEAYSQARTSGRGYATIRALRSDSLIIYQALTVTGTQDVGGALTGYRCLRHDVSEYKRDQEALLAAVESAPSGLLMLNSTGVMQSANRAVETLFGYRRAELIGQTVEMLLPYRLRAGHLGHRDDFNNNKESNAMAGRDLVGLRKDGNEIPLQLYLNRIATNSGELILCTIIDIAERVRYQQQLELAKQAAEAANQAKSDFLARMSHEIRTPMNLILGMNTLLLESQLTETQRQHLEISCRNGRRLLRLINGILDLSKVEAGMLKLQSFPFDLNEVINECSATMSSAIESKGLQFDIAIDGDVWLYWIGDAERVHQVLLNLVGNSMKFTARGKIGVRVLSENFGQGERGLRFEVTDTGCGVPPDKAELIFGSFQQAEESMNRPYEGTGLGLSIARTLVEMMGGKIWLENTGEPGSKFVFTAFFPIARKEEVRPKAGDGLSADTARSLTPGTRLLLVEDNPENMVLLRAYLDNLSLSLHFAPNGVEAVKKRQAANYDLIFMDIQMPIMDGYTATRVIRTWENASGLPRTPIVALTAHALSGAFQESIEAGCDGHLTKPVERTELIAAIVKFAKPGSHASPAIAAPIAARRPTFLANRKLDLVKLRAALAGGDFDAIRTIGHNCKGIGTGYGFPDISGVGSAMESAAMEFDLVQLEKSIGQFETCIDHSLSQLQATETLSEPGGGCPMGA